MSTRLFGLLLATILLAFFQPAQAQQPKKVPRIGFVSGTGDANNPGPSTEAFRRGLRDLGYIEGKNIVVEYRYAEGKSERYPSLVAELVELKVDVVVMTAFPAIRAAKQATKTIPIVMVTNVDPVETGLVDSLARPGGNITGLTRLTRDLSGKRLELLTELVPGMSRVGVLWDVDGSGIGFKEYETAARAIKVQLQSLGVRGPSPDLEGAFQAAVRGRASPFVTVRSSLLNRNSKRIADLAIKNRLASMYEGSEFIAAGGLVSYEVNGNEIFRRAVTYVDKILKGTKPAELPVEQPIKFEFVINLKTAKQIGLPAKQIGLTIPPNVLARADKVIR